MNPTQPPARSSTAPWGVARPPWGTLLLRTLLGFLLWGVLTGGDGWELGVPVIALAVASSVVLQPLQRVRLRPLGLLRFMGYFAARSVQAGFDVAWRALSPALPLAPAFVEHRLRLPPGPARIFLADTLSLLPGTLSAALQGDRLRLHVLDTRQPSEPGLRAAEAAVAALFGEPLKEVER